MITVRLQVRLGIDPEMQKGSQRCMQPQVIQTHLGMDMSSSKTAAWMREHWLDTPFEVTDNTFSNAAQRLIQMLYDAPHLRWMYYMLPEADRKRFQPLSRGYCDSAEE